MEEVVRIMQPLLKVCRKCRSTYFAGNDFGSNGSLVCEECLNILGIRCRSLTTRIHCCQVTGSSSAVICTRIQMITIQSQWVANRNWVSNQDVTYSLWRPSASCDTAPNHRYLFVLGPVSIGCSLVACALVNLWPDQMMVDVTAQLHKNTTIQPPIG